LGLALLYWVFVIVGALDIDMFGGDAAEGLLDAAAAKGQAAGGMFDAAAAKGEAVDGLLDAAAAKGEAADGLLDGPEAHGGAEGLLHAINLRRAPVTVTFSLIVFFAWIFSFLAVTYLGPALGMVLPAVVFELLVIVASLLLALPLTSLATKPLEPIFRQRHGKSRIDYVGSVCRIQTGRVDTEFGQATVEDGGAGLIIQVRDEGGALKRGDSALIIDYDREQEAYIVEAYDALLKEEKAGRRARRT
jgi:hypothetical protein